MSGTPSIRIRSPRGAACYVEVRTGAKVHQVAADAAELLGYVPDVLYALANDGEVLHWESECPTDGEYELVDTGGAV